MSEPLSAPDDWARRFGGIGRLYGEAALARFRHAHVCVIGVGGVGSWAAEALARIPDPATVDAKRRRLFAHLPRMAAVAPATEPADRLRATLERRFGPVPEIAIAAQTLRPSRSSCSSVAPNLSNRSKAAFTTLSGLAPGLSTLFTTTMGFRPRASAFLVTKRVWGMGPS